MEWYRRNDILERLSDARYRVEDSKSMGVADFVAIIDALYAIIDELIEVDKENDDW